MYSHDVMNTYMYMYMYSHDVMNTCTNVRQWCNVTPAKITICLYHKYDGKLLKYNVGKNV